ncbi:MAG: DUF6431 domain-containing protein [Actinobacteria bacterium]|nr:DUF6431 domain-containing protein [Actinomycetota bacterium]
MVSAEAARVEAELVDGRLGCPSCRAVLGPWGHARPRVLRCSIGDRWLRPRRARCRGCAGTHVLLPDVALLRRQDEVTVIGAAIRAHVGGEGHRRIAARLGVPAGRCCRPGAASRTHWRRSRSRRGRGCCGSGRVICGGSSACCREARCLATRAAPSRLCAELGRSRARERERWEN